jgi:hypothetical protein
MDLTTAAGIDEWVQEKAAKHLKQYANGDIPFTAYKYNMRKLFELATTCYERLRIVDRPVRHLNAVR